MPGSRNDGDVNKILSEGYGRTSKYYQFRQHLACLAGRKNVLYILVDTSQSSTGYLASCLVREIRFFAQHPRLMPVDAHGLRVVLCRLAMHSSSKAMDRRQLALIQHFTKFAQLVTLFCRWLVQLWCLLPSLLQFKEFLKGLQLSALFYESADIDLGANEIPNLASAVAQRGSHEEIHER